MVLDNPLLSASLHFPAAAAATAIHFKSVLGLGQGQGSEKAPTLGVNEGVAAVIPSTIHNVQNSIHGSILTKSRERKEKKKSVSFETIGVCLSAEIETHCRNIHALSTSVSVPAHVSIAASSDIFRSCRSLHILDTVVVSTAIQVSSTVMATIVVSISVVVIVINGRGVVCGLRTRADMISRRRARKIWKTRDAEIPPQSRTNIEKALDCT